MKLITEEISQVKFITEKLVKEKDFVLSKVYSFKVELKTEMGECIPLIFLKEKLTDTIKLL